MTENPAGQVVEGPTHLQSRDRLRNAQNQVEQIQKLLELVVEQQRQKRDHA